MQAQQTFILMNLENLIAVSGLSGIYRMAGNRSNGLIIEDLQSGKKRFASARKHQFTPLESIAIFTDDGESLELKKVFERMLEQLEDNPLANPNGSQDELFDYFGDILPNYDPDRVHARDVKKVIKWFDSLHKNGIFNFEEEE